MSNTFSNSPFFTLSKLLSNFSVFPEVCSFNLKDRFYNYVKIICKITRIDIRKLY